MSPRHWVLQSCHAVMQKQIRDKAPLKSQVTDTEELGECARKLRIDVPMSPSRTFRAKLLRGCHLAPPLSFLLPPSAIGYCHAEQLAIRNKLSTRFD